MITPTVGFTAHFARESLGVVSELWEFESDKNYVVKRGTTRTWNRTRSLCAQRRALFRQTNANGVVDVAVDARNVM